MDNVKVPPLYQKYFIDKQDERRMMFEKIKDLYEPQKGLYPGSFVHITPSFFFEDMTYIDSDKRITKFFKDENLTPYIENNKHYDKSTSIRGYEADYCHSLPIDENSFDIMFSFYGGFISQTCKKYLKEKAILVCNNSHGDATLACCDKEYRLIGVIKRKGSHFSISQNDLDSYFIKKDKSPIDRDRVLEKMIGENFTKKGYAYLFSYKD